MAGPKATGIGVDASGGSVVDPTANVIALVEANAKAASDLRAADQKFNDAQAAHIKELGALWAAHAETLRINDLDRLDKTRQVDVLAASASASALATAVQTLANTADRNADALRNLVNATAATMAKQTSDQAATLSAATDSLVKDINARIAELQKAQYQGVGKSSVADPQMERLAGMVEKIALAQESGSGRASVVDPQVAELRAEVARLSSANSTRTGFDAGKAAAIAGAGLLGGGGVVALIMNFLKN